VGEGQTRRSEIGGEDAFRAGGDGIDPLAAVVGKGWAIKGKSAIPVRGPSVAVFGTGEGKTELAKGVDRVGGEVIHMEDGEGRTRQRVRDRGTRDA
jgi:hypothetical protein